MDPFDFATKVLFTCQIIIHLISEAITIAETVTIPSVRRIFVKKWYHLGRLFIFYTPKWVPPFYL